MYSNKAAALSIIEEIRRQGEKAERTMNNVSKS